MVYDDNGVEGLQEHRPNLIVFFLALQFSPGRLLLILVAVWLKTTHYPFRCAEIISCH